LFVYFMLYGKNAQVPVDVLVANIPWCPSDSSQDLRLNALYNVYVAPAGVPPLLGAICPDGLESGGSQQILVVPTQGRTSVKNPVEAAGF